jgi:hypothetical protein
MCELGVLVLFAFVLRVPEDDDVSLKHVGEFHMCGLLFTVLYELYELVGVCG